MTKPDISPVRRSGITRCAIYTRKSTEDGLAQDFSSLDAQREASAAYIKSQKLEGWQALPDVYDDGGISGATMARPALQRLIGDINAGRVDTVVVYKVDRLTRSLADFAKIVDIFDAKGVAFVSVTQSFNTTTSMGRLTLNMLLSFAQFEREVTAERIRDKIAASKKKGMWMGGTPPLGYDVKDRKLIVDTEEADKVRYIFGRYASLGSINLLKRELDRDKFLSKHHFSKTGRSRGGIPFCRGGLYTILQNRTYLGETHHNSQYYPGEHEAIVDFELWSRVEQRLEVGRTERQTGIAGRTPALLMHLLHDERGHPMAPAHAVKKSKRYRYYVTRPLLRRRRAAVTHGRRLQAGDIERVVRDRLTIFLTSKLELKSALSASIPTAPVEENLIEQAALLARALIDGSAVEQRLTILAMIARADIVDDHIDIHLNVSRLIEILSRPGNQPQRFKDYVPIEDCLILSTRAFRRSFGRDTKLIIPGRVRLVPNEGLIKLIAKAFAWRDKLEAAPGRSIKELAVQAGGSGSYATRLMRLTFLAPDIIDDFLNGRHPRHLNAGKLIADTRLPLSWAEQRAVLHRRDR